MIIYYSGTGNTMHVARRTADALNTGLTRIGFDYATECDDDVLGICLPTYFYGIPKSAADALKMLSIKEGAYIFLILTCGNSTGAAAEAVRRILALQNKKLSAVFDTVMPDSFIKSVDVPRPDVQKQILASSDAECDKIIRHILNRDFGSFQRHKGPVPHLMSAIGSILYRPFGRNTDKLTISCDCTKCLKCVRACPTGTVRFDGKIKFVDAHCDGCLACINICPTRAIQFGDITKRKERYIHPDYTVR